MYNALPVRNKVAEALSSSTPEEQAWTVESYILANIFDAIQALNYVTQVANSPKHSKPRKPDAHPRPRKNKAKISPKNYPGRTIYKSE